MLLKRLELVFMSAWSIAPQADLEAQKAFKKTFSTLKAVLPAHVDTLDVDIWFEDEMRVGQRNTMTRIWALKGSRCHCAPATISVCLSVWGWSCHRFGLVLPYANKEMMAHHLTQISLAVPKGRHAVLDR